MPISEKCPGAPAWARINAKPKHIYEPANEAIERSYLSAPEHTRDAVLLGSEFLYGGNLEIQLPRDSKYKSYGNRLLTEMRGLSQQLRPDIIDFENRVFYEIKTEENAIDNAAKVEDQLANYYRVAEQVRVSYGVDKEPEWKQDYATWKPPAVLPLPGDPLNLLVCTAATDYRKWPHGLILYDVRQKTGKPGRKVKRIAVRSFDTDFKPLTRSSSHVIRAIETFAEPEHPEFVITAPSRLHEEWKRTVETERELEGMRTGVPPAFDLRHPFGRWRVLSWAAIGAGGAVILASTFVVVSASALLAGGAAAAAAAGGANAAGVASGGTVVALNAFRAMAASKEVVKAAAAAGVIAVLGTPKYALAQADKTSWRLAELLKVEISDVDAVRIVPADHFKLFGASSAQLVRMTCREITGIRTRRLRSLSRSMRS